MSATPSTEEIIRAWGGELAGKRDPSGCTARHQPRVPCVVCKNTAPLPNILSDTPGTPQLLQHRFWYPNATFTNGRPSTTTDEHRAEIFAATDRYNEARTALDRANDALIVAHRARRDAARRGAAPSEQRDRDAALARAERAITTAENEAAGALRELNFISIPPHQRIGGHSLIERVRRMVFA